MFVGLAQYPKKASLLGVHFVIFTFELTNEKLIGIMLVTVNAAEELANGVAQSWRIELLKPEELINRCKLIGIHQAQNLMHGDVAALLRSRLGNA